MKRLFLPYAYSQRFRVIWLIALTLIGLSAVTRLVLLLHSKEQIDWSVLNVTGIFVIGFFYDLINLSYFLTPLLLYLWLIPQKLFAMKFHTYILYALYFLMVFALLFNAVAEYFFWDEFTTRFNFIAVDYLIYTTEVIGNIRESYPIEWILIGLLVIAGLLTYFTRSFLSQETKGVHHFKQRTMLIMPLIILSILNFAFIDNNLHQFSTNAVVNELAGNGMYELFAAYRRNELDYESFYPHIKDDQAIRYVRHALEPEDSFLLNDSTSIVHTITSTKSSQKLNVVLISVESLSASFMKLFGNDKNITPFLDSLAQHSLTFTNLFATGTRTVRGLEALSISIPPTPGQSIVRRPHNEHLFSLATVFNQAGYESKFIYGGYGYFDNMNYFFENNGYTVVDRTALEDHEIDYENIWGVADENLFTLAIREIEKTLATGKSSFTHIMTTSNHRPYTYPEGRIDIPSHTSRSGAVKYTDYAIRKFIKEASTRPWYDNTVFIITADHCASSAGKVELPIQKYKIPMLIFSPKHFGHIVQNRLMSQIDIGPTVLGLLNFSYTSKFFGHDIFTLREGKERAFISTYQVLGFLKSDSLVVLKPRHEPEVFLASEKNETPIRINGSSDSFSAAKEAISWYQSASYEFKHGKLKDEEL